METIQIWISHYGYAGLFFLTAIGIVGLPVPDETLLTLSGYLIYKGRLNLIPAFLCAYMGSITGISISYIIGRTLGYRIILKYGHYIHITNERIQKAHDWFEKTGRWTLTIGYFFPGIRHIAALIAGASNLKFRDLAIFAYTGGLIWTGAFISIGYLFGKEHFIIQSTRRYLLIALAAIVIFSSLLYYIRKRSREPNGPYK